MIPMWGIPQICLTYLLERSGSLLAHLVQQKVSGGEDRKLVVGVPLREHPETGESMTTTPIGASHSSTEGDRHEMLGVPDRNALQERCSNGQRSEDFHGPSLPQSHRYIRMCGRVDTDEAW